MEVAAATRGKLEYILEARRRETRASRTTVGLEVPAAGFCEVWLTPTTFSAWRRVAVQRRRSSTPSRLWWERSASASPERHNT